MEAKQPGDYIFDDLERCSSKLSLTSSTTVALSDSFSTGTFVCVENRAARIDCISPSCMYRVDRKKEKERNKGGK